MRTTPALLAVVTFASALSAQGARPLRGATVGDGSVLQTVTFDVAGAFQERYRATTEALVFGRFTIGFSGEYTKHSENQTVYYPMPMGCPIEMLCASDAGVLNGQQYRAWSFNIHGRWYPSALSFEGVRQSASVYVGEFVGYHERRTTTSSVGCPYCAGPVTADSVGLPLDSTVVYPPVPYPYPGGLSFTQKVHGWEPGAEFGVRIKPARHVVIDMGGTFRVETISDPQSGVRPGGVVKQLTVAVGVGW